MASFNGYVYLLQELDFNKKPTGLYKIGKTTQDTTEKRKRQYKTGNARPISTFAEVMVQDPQGVETTLHRYYHDERIKGMGGGDEWFKFDYPGQVVQVMQRYGQLVHMKGCDQETTAQQAWREHKEAQKVMSKSIRQIDCAPITDDFLDSLTKWCLFGLGGLFIVSLITGASKQVFDSINSRPSETKYPGSILYDRPNGTPTGYGIPSGTKVTIDEQQGNWCKTPDRTGTSGAGWFKCGKASNSQP